MKLVEGLFFIKNLKGLYFACKQGLLDAGDGLRVDVHESNDALSGHLFRIQPCYNTRKRGGAEAKKKATDLINALLSKPEIVTKVGDLFNLLV